MNVKTRELSAQEIAARLAKALSEQEGIDESCGSFPYPSDLLPDAPRPAAVLIPLLRQDGAWHVLFTRRHAHLAEHSGQVAFPGGRADPGDGSPEGTALREAEEEIGVAPQDVRVLGRLEPFRTITNYCVTPVVGEVPWPYPLRLSPVEVSRAFTIPLGWLADPSHFEERQRELPPPFGVVGVIYFDAYHNEVLWGASARFTLRLLRVLGLLADDGQRHPFA